MAIQLSDDGTMDTVLVCSECGQEFRYNFDPRETDSVDEENGVTSEGDAYDRFVAWAMTDASEDHSPCPPARAPDVGRGSHGGNEHGNPMR